MTKLIALFLAQLLVNCAALLASNSLPQGAVSSSNRHEIFRHESGRFRKPTEKSMTDTVDAEDISVNKKIFADRFIHPSKLKHGVVHVTVPALDEMKKVYHHHLHQSMPLKSKFHWSKMTTPLLPDELEAPITQSTLPPTTPQPTTTTAKPVAAHGGTPSWLVDDWEDDEDENEKPKPPLLVDSVPHTPPPSPPTQPPLVHPIIHDTHDVKAVHSYHVGADHGMPSYSIFDIPVGSATEIPVIQHNKHHPPSTRPPLTTTKAPPPTTTHPKPVEQHHIIRPVAKPNSFSNLKLLNLGTETANFPTLDSDGLLKPDNDIADHLGLEGGVVVGADAIPAASHFPGVHPKHARIDGEQPYFHSKTDYLEMPHAFPTAEDLRGTTHEMPVIDDALQPTLQAGPGGDTFVLKIPEEGAPSIVTANIVPVIGPAPVTSHRKFHEPVVKPEPAKPAHFQTTSAPYLRTNSPFHRPITDFDGGIMSPGSTTPHMPIIDEGDTAVGWSAWTLKVSCSRPCGMGIEIYERSCQITAICSNRTTLRYKTCAQQVCPSEDTASKKEDDQTPSATYSTLAYSSRHRQCTKFNSQPFDGLFYEWTPYYTTTGQCELFCLAKSANFYHKFGDQVEDGTACDPYSESSICIKGKCHPVGCDGVVGSQLKRDRCGVCGGFNESCNTFDGLVLSGDFTLGYHDIIRLPIGATNIFVHEMAPSINNLALHLESGEYVLNGDYHIGLSKKVFAGSVLFIYVHNDKQEESLFAEGPLTEPVIIAMLYQSDHVNIHYEYSLPKPGFQPRNPAYAHGPTVTPSTPSTSTHAPSTTSRVVTPPLVPSRYTWLAGEWSACSVTCGTGNRLRVVTCIDSLTGNVVGDDLCPMNSRLENVENCRLDTCTVRWKVGNWSACSKRCGPGSGIQRRPVECVEFASPEMQTVGKELCERLGQPKPPSEQMCKPSEKCPHWTIGEWSSCQTICGEGNQTRTVTCTLPENTTGECDDETKPANWQKCQGRPCAFMVDWIVSAWSPCVDSCGGGVSTRKVRCATPKGQMQPSTFCRFKPRPSHLRKCQPNENLCRPRWTTGNWSNCSSICGLGVQTRSVVCVHLQQEVPYALEDEYCHESRPESEQVCNGSACGFTWFIGPWTACSATCGTGHRTRAVLCLDGDGKQVEGKQCPLESKPHYRQKCEGAIKHCSLKQQQEASGSLSTMSLLQQKAMQNIHEDCTAEDYGCCPDGVTAATGPFNAGCPNITCMETKFGCCPNSFLPAQGPAGEGCQTEFVSTSDCAETMFGCCPDALTPAKGLDLRGCDGLCHDTRFGCCPDNVHPAAGVNFENCPGLNCSESQFGCCPDGIRPAPAPDGKGCPNDGLEMLPPAEFVRLTTTLQYIDQGSSVGDVILKIQRENATTVADTTLPLKSTEETTTTSSTTTTTTTTTMEVTTTTTTTEAATTTIEMPVITTVEQELTTVEEEIETTEETKLPETTLAEIEETKMPETTPKVDEDDEPVTEMARKEHTTEPVVTCADTEFGCCADGETSARGPNMEGCPASMAECLTSMYGCCEDGLTLASGPDGEGCPENEDEETEEGDEEVTETEGSGAYLPATIIDNKSTELISTSAMPEGESATTVADSSLESGYITSSSGSYSSPTEEFTTAAETYTSDETTTEEPTTIQIEFKSEIVTRAPIPECKDSRYGCCPDDKTPSGGPNLENCFVNCSIPYEAGECDTHELSWYYDAIHGVCARFWYSGCGGNTNRFATEEQCKAKCVNPLSGLERCVLPPIRGPCNRYSDKDWHYFDVHSMSCRSFEYGGCNGNNNRFESKKDCEDGCIEVVKRDICQQTAQVGPCRASLRRWHFNSTSNRCEIFIYGGCHGNLNRFSTAHACFAMCGGEEPAQRHHGTLSPVDAVKALARSAKPTPGHRCSERKESGPCKAHMRRWFFDSDTATCRQFVYGGCRGNGNNFGTAEECQKVCGGKVDETDRKHATLRAKHPACLLAPDAGPCTDHVKRYHYDAATLSCSGFWFGGCGGNQNNFPDMQHCESVCRPDESTETIYDTEEDMEEEDDEDFEEDYEDFGPTSKNPPSKIIEESVATHTSVTAATYSEDDPLDCLEDFSYGDCTDKIDVWTFDQAAVACVARSYSGCGGSSNRFATFEACQRTCIQSQRGLSSTKTLVTVPTTAEITGSGAYVIEDQSSHSDLITPSADSCNLPREVGTCSNSILRFFYDAASDSCRPFFYTGCGGNANNFDNEAECLRTCLKDPTGEKMKELREVEDCFQLPDQGPCDNQILRWYFDFEHDRRCKTFYYGGCGGGKNNFVAHDDCVSFCSQAKCPTLARCDLATTTGACPYGLLVDANGCELCQCHDPCQRTKCAVDEICLVEKRDGKYVAQCEPEPESDSCSESEHGCCPDGVTLSYRADHSDCPEMAPEIITSGPTYIEAAVGETVTLLCRARGTPTPEIVWYKDLHHLKISPAFANRLKKLSDGSLEITNLLPNDTANYTCRAHNSVDDDESAEAASASTRTYQIIVQVPAKIVSRVEPGIVAKLGSSILLPCVAEGNPAPEMSWYFGEKMIKSDIPDVQQTPEGLKIGPVETRHIGSYKCIAENSNGQDQRSITVDMEESLAVRILPHNVSYQVGSELALTCEGSGFPRPRLRWQKNSGHLKHATIVEQISESGSIARLTIDSLQVSDSGNYICIAANRHQEERQQTSIRVKQAGDELPSNCVDKPQFANCGLIVAARLCGHQAFAKFCCESCFKAGQLRQKVLTN